MGFSAEGLERVGFDLFGLDPLLFDNSPIGDRIEVSVGGLVTSRDRSSFDRVTLVHQFLRNGGAIAAELRAVVETARVDSANWAAREFVNHTQPWLGLGPAYEAEVADVLADDWLTLPIIVDGREREFRGIGGDFGRRMAREQPPLRLYELTDSEWSGQRRLNCASVRYGEHQGWWDYPSLEVLHGELSDREEWLTVRSSVWPGKDPRTDARGHLRTAVSMGRMITKIRTGVSQPLVKPFEPERVEQMTLPVDGQRSEFSLAEHSGYIAAAAYLSENEEIVLWGRWKPENLELRHVQGIDHYANADGLARLRTGPTFFRDSWVALREMSDGTTLWLSSYGIRPQDLRLQRITDIHRYLSQHIG